MSFTLVYNLILFCLVLRYERVASRCLAEWKAQKTKTNGAAPK
jgi:hypothetical protein